MMRCEANMFADEDYLGDFELRLRKSASRYRGMPLAELRTLDGLFRIRRRPSTVGDGNVGKSTVTSIPRCIPTLRVP